MSYVIFKEKDSRSIKGLLISELPSISKPKMRTLITSIDGKNGDIVEELGYEAYSKKLKIGLYGNFNIDEVIQFFNGKGDVIFSNEADKYYKSQIVNQIDYDRLLRFRTAIIEFHVQPYKYLLNEEVIDKKTTGLDSIKAINRGLETSQPILTLYGSGEITITINNVDSFKVNIDEEYIVVDSELEEAYKDKKLKNRNMAGDFPAFKSGDNIVTWTGNLTRIKIDPKSRWL